MRKLLLFTIFLLLSSGYSLYSQDGDPLRIEFTDWDAAVSPKQTRFLTGWNSGEGSKHFNKVMQINSALNGFSIKSYSLSNAFSILNSFSTGATLVVSLSEVRGNHPENGFASLAMHFDPAADLDGTTATMPAVGDQTGAAFGFLHRAGGTLTDGRYVLTTTKTSVKTSINPRFYPNFYACRD